MRAVRLTVLWCVVAARAVAQPTEPELPADQQRAVRAIERLNGSAVRASRLPGQPITDVSFYHSVSDADLDLLDRFPELRTLWVRGGGLTDAGLARLTTHRNLGHLELEYCPVTDAGLAALANFPKLERLGVGEMPISDAGLPHLAKCPRLRVIAFYDAAVTDEGVDRLKAAMPYTLISVYRRGDPYQLNTTFAAGFTWRVVALLALFAAAGFGLARCVPAQRLRRIWQMPVVAGAVLLMGVALLSAAPRAYPVRDGDAAHFWLRACGIDVGVKNPSPGAHGVYLPRDGWYIYYDQGIHGRLVHRVPAADAEALFPKVADRLRQAPPGVLHPDVEAAIREWDRSGAAPGDAAGFLAKLREARLAQLQRENPRLYQYVLPEEDEFSDRWRRIGHFHWNLWFEFTFLIGLILFAAWPWLRNAGRWQWAAHVALLPALLCLPYWLGYAPLTFTSGGETGGILYPRLVIEFRGLPWSDLDTSILRALPSPLEPLSQTPGPMMSLSGLGAPGVVAMTALGLIAGLAVILATEAVRRRKQLRHWLVTRTRRNP
jgi:hypothetical protein